jgi:hypothetical protein
MLCNCTEHALFNETLIVKSVIATFIVCLFFYFSCDAQVFINESKNTVERSLKWDMRKYKHNNVAQNTDTSYTFLLRDTSVHPMDIYCHFTQKKCDYQKITLTCDSCYKLLVKKIIEQKSFKWISVKRGEYLSTYSKQLLLSSNEIEHSITITKFVYTKEEYDKIIESDTNLTH